MNLMIISVQECISTVHQPPRELACSDEPQYSYKGPRKLARDASSGRARDLCFVSCDLT